MQWLRCTTKAQEATRGTFLQGGSNLTILLCNATRLHSTETYKSESGDRSFSSMPSAVKKYPPSLWASLLSNPAEWRDCRQYKKETGKIGFPDFVQPANRDLVLWLESRHTPAGIQQQLSNMQVPLYKDPKPTAAPWTSLLSNPTEWQDWRQYKAQTGKFQLPDFRHATDRSGLWVDSLPPGVQEQLKQLNIPIYENKTSVASLWASLLSNPAEWHDYRQYKLQKGNTRMPDFRHAQDGGGLWIDSAATPASAREKLDQLQVPLYEGRNPSQSTTTSTLWRSLLSNPAEWHDYRSRKQETGETRLCDFRHNATGQPLWLDSISTPEWVVKELANIKVPSSERLPADRSLWTSLLSSPDEWRDCRQYKRQTGKTKFPDFVHMDDERKALWIVDGRTPDWIPRELGKIQVPLYVYQKNTAQALAVEAAWKSLMDNCTEWRDCRKFKARHSKPKFPDFKHLHSNRALWLDSCSTPAWVQNRLMKVIIPEYEEGMPNASNHRHGS